MKQIFYVFTALCREEGLLNENKGGGGGKMKKARLLTGVI